MENFSRICGKLINPALLAVIVLIAVDVSQRIVTSAVRLDVQIGIRDELAALNARK